MYLVHAHLEMASGAQLPLNIKAVVRSAITAADRVEHVAVHCRSSSELTLGFYLLACTIDEAEEQAVRVCHRLLRDVPPLAAARLAGVGVPLVPLAFVPQSVD